MADVGCGSGILFTTAAEFGFEAVGIDARRDVVDALVRLGLSTRNLCPFERNLLFIVQHVSGVLCRI